MPLGGALQGVPGLACGLVRERAQGSSIAQSLGLSGPLLPHQVHGAEVRVVRTAEDAVGRCDALIVDRPGLLVGVLGADCPGVLLVDPGHHVLAVVHSGWQGTAARVVSVVLAALAEGWGSQPEQVRVALGPSIRRDRYEVDDPVVEALGASLTGGRPPGAVVATRPGHACVDIAAFIVAQLIEGGVASGHIEDAGLCTQGDPGWHSHRRDGARAGRHLLVAGFTESRPR